VSFRLDDFWSSNLELSNAFNTASEFYNIKNEEINEYIKNKIYTKYLSNIRVATVNIKSICIKLNHWRPIDHIS
jgi:predicted transglutaminase-like protease